LMGGLLGKFDADSFVGVTKISNSFF